MGRYYVRPLEQDDFATLMSLEEAIFASQDEKVLGPYYIRLCCEFYRESCFLAFDGERPVGYLLSFIRGREAYCTTLAVTPEAQGTRVVTMIIRAFVSAIVARCDSCWFTVKEDNQAARNLHRSLGARDVEVRGDFYGPGDERIVSVIDRDAFSKLRSKYQRLGLIDGVVQPHAHVAAL